MLELFNELMQCIENDQQDYQANNPSNKEMRCGNPTGHSGHCNEGSQADNSLGDEMRLPDAPMKRIEPGNETSQSNSLVQIINDIDITYNFMAFDA